MISNRISRLFHAGILLGFSALLFSCASQPPRFKSTQDEQQHHDIRTYMAGRDIVWNSVMDTIRDYKIFKQDPVQGLILTSWREKVVKGAGGLGGTWMHGVKVEDRSDTQGGQNMSQFVIKNRLHIVVSGNADSTTVSVTNYFTARPKDFFGRKGDDVEYGNKSYSVSDFDTREQYVILNRIGEALEKARK